MTVSTETATVYRGGGRRWFSLKAALKAEAIAIIKRKHPSEASEQDEFGRTYDPDFHWRNLNRSDVLLRRMMRLCAKSICTPERAPLESPHGEVKP